MDIKKTYLKKKPNLIRGKILQLTKPVTISENDSREWRFQCIARLYLVEKYSVILTGHTATDQVETAFLQLLRGTSLHGLVCFRYSKMFKPIYPKYPHYSIFFHIQK